MQIFELKMLSKKIIPMHFQYFKAAIIKTIMKELQEYIVLYLFYLHRYLLCIHIIIFIS